MIRFVFLIFAHLDKDISALPSLLDQVILVKVSSLFYSFNDSILLQMAHLNLRLCFILIFYIIFPTSNRVEYSDFVLTTEIPLSLLEAKTRP